MGKFYRSKYRIQSNRADWWDYSSQGCYFVTITTLDRNHFFGEIKNGFMCQSELCQIAVNNWEEIPKKFDSFELGEFVFMPDHMHGLIFLEKPKENRANESTSLLNKTGGITGQNNPMLQTSLGSAIRAFKAKTSFECKKINPNFGWASNYYDRIVRSPKSLWHIENYIENNIKNWNGNM
jgi:putative transposase